MSEYFAVTTPNIFVKPVKDALKAHGVFDKAAKITKIAGAGVFCIPTNLPAISDEDGSRKRIEGLLSESNIDPGGVNVQIIVISRELAEESNDTRNNALQNALKTIMTRLPPEVCELVQPYISRLIHNVPRPYCIYSSLLLLPAHKKSHDAWMEFLESGISSESLMAFWTFFCDEMGVSHVALNAPIPAQADHSNGAGNAEKESNDGINSENLIRSPLNIIRLHGDFGPDLLPFPIHEPTKQDFEEAYWVSTTQNGIKQVWAPHYTMFSAGNVTEKARILKLPTVHTAVADGELNGRGCTAVDLFAGIGYFAFSYAKAGVSKVLCWDLNPWSIEGLRRGAELNSFAVSVITPEMLPTSGVNMTSLDLGMIARSPGTSKHLIAFNESNVHAEKRLKTMQHLLPPIRHVNCGMLPSIGEAWKIAVQAIDPELGGWLHLHETVHEKSLKERTEAIRKAVAGHVDELSPQGGGNIGSQVVLEHVETVKSIGPRLWHLVLDIWVPPRPVLAGSCSTRS